MTTLKFCDDIPAERVMDMVGVEFCTELIKVSSIDWEASRNNCARTVTTVNHEKIDEYRNAILRGCVFPRPVIQRGSKRHLVLGGNQRCLAIKEMPHIKTIEVYMIDEMSPSQHEGVLRSLNSAHGWGETKDEKIAHAVQLVQDEGFTVADAASLMSVTTHSISGHCKAVKTRARLAAAGIDSGVMSIRALAAVSRLSRNQEKELATAAVKHQLTAVQVDDIVKQVQPLNSNTAQTKVLRKAVRAVASLSDASTSSKGSVRRPRRTKLLHLLNELNAFLERGNANNSAFSNLDELQITSDIDVDTVRELIAPIVIRLNTIGRDQ